MTKAAAFFDLDKTLLAKSSTLAYAKPLYQSGMLTRQDLMRSAYGQFVYLVAGANEQQMDQMRVYMSELDKGWDVEHVKVIAAEGLSTVIEPIVYAEALTLFDEHHAAGRDVIVISSSGTSRHESGQGVARRGQGSSMASSRLPQARCDGIQGSSRAQPRRGRCSRRRRSSRTRLVRAPPTPQLARARGSFAQKHPPTLERAAFLRSRARNAAR